MFHANVELFYRDQHEYTSINALSKNKKVLFCSLIRHIEQTTFQYMRDLLRWQKKLDDYGVTLYLLTSQPIQVANITGNEVTIENKIDASIIGGFILRVGDLQYDASIANKLSNIKREFSNSL